MLYPLSYEGGAGAKRGRKTLCPMRAEMRRPIVGPAQAVLHRSTAASGVVQALFRALGRGEAACASWSEAFRRLGR